MCVVRGIYFDFLAFCVFFLQFPQNLRILQKNAILFLHSFCFNKIISVPCVRFVLFARCACSALCIVLCEPKWCAACCVLRVGAVCCVLRVVCCVLCAVCALRGVLFLRTVSVSCVIVSVY